MSQVAVTPLTLEQVRKLAADGQSVWVMNYTDKGNQRNRGTLHITAQDENGSSFAITIPNTWIPINLSEYGSVIQLLKSNSFLDTFRKRDLIFIAGEEATKLLASGEAQAEKAKVDQKYNSATSSAGGNEQIKISQVSSINENMIASGIAGEDKNQPSHSDKLLISIVDRLEGGALDPSQALSELKSISPAPQMNYIQEALMRVTVTTTDFYRELIRMQETAGQGSQLDENFRPAEAPASA